MLRARVQAQATPATSWPHFQALDLLLQRSGRGSATKQDRELTYKPGPRWDHGAVFSTTLPLPTEVGETTHPPTSLQQLRLCLVR